MAIGYPKDKGHIDSLLGEVAQQTNRNFRRARQLKTELDQVPDAALTNLGYTSTEVTQLREFAANLAQLADIYSGQATLTSLKDFRPSFRPMWGVLGDH